MKKLFTLFTMLLLSVGVSWGGIEVGKHYTIQVKYTTTSNNVYLGVNSSNELTFLKEAASDLSQVWVVRASGNTSYPYKFESRSNSGYFLSSANSKGMSTTGGWFSLASESNGGAVIRGSKDTDASSTSNILSLGTWNPSGTSNKTGFGGSYSGGCWSSYSTQYISDVWSDVYIFTEVTDDNPITDGYYYIKSKDTARHPYLYNDATYASNVNKLTLQSSTKVTSNKGVWKIEATSSNTIDVKNGDGKPLVAGNSSKGIMGTYSTLNIYDYATTDGVTNFYFSEALNCSSTSGSFQYDATHCYLTTWSAGGSSKDDNRWIFESVDVSGKQIYDVVVTGNDEGYATLNGEYAFNGGFFISDSEISESDISYKDDSDYTITKKLSNKTITITYTSNNATADDITAAKSIIKTDVGYPLTTTDAYNNLNNLTTSSEITKAALAALVQAYKTETNVQLPVDGKAYTFTNYSNNSSQNLRYVKYTNGSTLSTTTTEGEASVFVAKKISDGVYVFVTSDGNFLTWPYQGEGYTEGSSIYGYSTKYSATNTNKDDWNKITVKKDANEAKNFGHMRLVARRGGNAVSSFIVKGSTGAWDRAGDSHFLDETGSNWYSSAWYITEVTHTNTDAENCAIAKVSAIEGVSGKTLGNNIGQYHAGQIVTTDDYKNAINNATTVDAVTTIFNSVAINQPKGKFVTFYNKQTQKYLKNTPKDKTTLDVQDNSDKNTVFYIDAENDIMAYENGYYIKNVFRLGQGSYTDDYSVTYAYKAPWFFEEGTNKGYYKLKYGNQSESYHYMKGTSDGSGISWTDTPNSDDADWQIAEVTSLPLTISSAGYATFSAPVKVTPSAGYTVYTVNSASSTSASLTEQTAAIPANCGVLVQGTEGTCTMTITDDDTFDDSDNMLKPVVAAATIDAGTTAYILAKDDEKGVGFYLLDGSDRTISGHKAYLETTSSVARFLSFSFGEDATGINEAVVTEAQDGKFIENGQLVIVKGGVKYNVAGQIVK